MNTKGPTYKEFSLDELETLVNDKETSDIVLILAYQWTRNMLHNSRARITWRGEDKSGQLESIHSKLLKRAII